MVTRHDLVIIKKAQRQLANLSKVAEKMKKFEAAKDLEDQSAVLFKVISYFEDMHKKK